MTPRARDSFPERAAYRSGLVATSSVVLLDVLSSTRSPADYRVTGQRLSLALELAPIDQPILDPAVELQALLADRSRHRDVSLPDLLIAATAERHGLIGLHYDVDFEPIADVSGQAVEWVVHGSVA